MTPAIRLATEGDLDVINAIYNHYVLTSTCTAEVTPVTLDQRRAWLAARDVARYPVTVLEQEGDVLGWAALSPYHPRWGYRFTVENSVYVRNDQHGRGFGRALLADVIARAVTLGYRSIVALVSADQAPSVTLHVKAGFVEVGRLPGVIHKMDRWIELVLLQRMLL